MKNKTAKIIFENAKQEVLRDIESYKSKIEQKEEQIQSLHSDVEALHEVIKVSENRLDEINKFIDSPLLEWGE